MLFVDPKFWSDSCIVDGIDSIDSLKRVEAVPFETFSERKVDVSIAFNSKVLAGRDFALLAVFWALEARRLAFFELCCDTKMRVN